jgi:hypothetical protein
LPEERTWPAVSLGNAITWKLDIVFLLGGLASRRSLPGTAQCRNPFLALKLQRETRTNEI